VLASYAIGLGGIVILAVAWAAVQGAWKKVFPDAVPDPDVLAGRMGCHGCDCTDDCDRQEGE